jgi:hypothetical protein
MIYFYTSTIGFFDGVVVGGISRVGLFLKLNTDHVYKDFFAGGEGNNIKEETLGLWGLLSFSKRI